MSRYVDRATCADESEVESEAESEEGFSQPQPEPGTKGPAKGLSKGLSKGSSKGSSKGLSKARARSNEDEDEDEEDEEDDDAPNSFIAGDDEEDEQEDEHGSSGEGEGEEDEEDDERVVTEIEERANEQRRMEAEARRLRQREADARRRARNRAEAAATGKSPSALSAASPSSSKSGSGGSSGGGSGKQGTLTHFFRRAALPSPSSAAPASAPAPAPTSAPPAPPTRASGGLSGTKRARDADARADARSDGHEDDDDGASSDEHASQDDDAHVDARARARARASTPSRASTGLVAVRKTGNKHLPASHIPPKPSGFVPTFVAGSSAPSAPASAPAPTAARLGAEASAHAKPAHAPPAGPVSSSRAGASGTSASGTSASGTSASGTSASGTSASGTSRARPSGPSYRWRVTLTNAQSLLKFLSGIYRTIPQMSLFLCRTADFQGLRLYATDASTTLVCNSAYSCAIDAGCTETGAPLSDAALNEEFFCVASENFRLCLDSAAEKESNLTITRYNPSRERPSAAVRLSFEAAADTGASFAVFECPTEDTADAQRSKIRKDEEDDSIVYVDMALRAFKDLCGHARRVRASAMTFSAFVCVDPEDEAICHTRISIGFSGCISGERVYQTSSRKCEPKQRDESIDQPFEMLQFDARVYEALQWDKVSSNEFPTEKVALFLRNMEGDWARVQLKQDDPLIFNVKTADFQTEHRIMCVRKCALSVECLVPAPPCTCDMRTCYAGWRRWKMTRRYAQAPQRTRCHVCDQSAQARARTRPNARRPGHTRCLAAPPLHDGRETEALRLVRGQRKSSARGLRRCRERQSLKTRPAFPCRLGQRGRPLPASWVQRPTRRARQGCCQGWGALPRQPCFECRGCTDLRPARRRWFGKGRAGGARRSCTAAKCKARELCTRRPGRSAVGAEAAACAQAAAKPCVRWK